MVRFVTDRWDERGFVLSFYEKRNTRHPFSDFKNSKKNRYDGFDAYIYESNDNALADAYRYDDP